MTDHEVLGVSPDATDDEIKRAYKRLAIKYHPDADGDESNALMFNQATEAYDRLMSRGAEENGECHEELATRSIPGWADHLAWTIARHYGCRSKATRRKGKRALITFLGLEHRVSVATWLFRVLANELFAKATRAAREQGMRGPTLVKFRNRFLISAACEIYSRMNPIPEERKRQILNELKDNPPDYDPCPAPLTEAELEAIHAGSLGRVAGNSISIDDNAVGDREKAGHLTHRLKRLTA